MLEPLSCVIKLWLTNLSKETELSKNHIGKVRFPRNSKDLEIRIFCKRKISVYPNKEMLAFRPFWLVMFLINYKEASIFEY